MATNYTTKTASLKATTADIRKLRADDLSIKDETTGKYVDVMDAIDKASSDAVAAAGIQVTRDLTGDYDNLDAGEVLSVKTKKMNFFGTYVNVVQSDENPDEISIYIGENKNPSEFSDTTKLTNPTTNATARYIYSGDGYSVGSFKTDGSTTYNKTQQQSATALSVYGGANGTVFTIPNKSTKIKLEALQGSTVIASAQTPAIDGKSTPVTVTGQVGGKDAITLTIKDIVENTSNDAQLGLTPGFLRCKIEGSVTTSNLLPNGGAYKLKITVGEGATAKTATTDELYVWKTDTRTPSVGEVKATYTSTATRVVSGITYDTAARVAIEVKDVANTQFMQGTSTNRLKVTSAVTSMKPGSTSSPNATIGTVGSSGVLTVSGLTGTDKTTNSAVYSYTSGTDVAKITDTTDTPMLITANITAQACNANGGGVAGTAKTVAMTGQVNYFCDKADATDSDAKMNFMNDGTRLSCTVLTDTDGNVSGIDLASKKTWTSSTDITNTKDALVQNGYLMHPKNDVTGKYTSATGTRFYTKLIKTGTTAADKTSYVISCPNGGLTASGVTLWAVAAQDGAGKTAGNFAWQLNKVANTESLSNTKIEIIINPNTMTCLANSAFYLVVQIAEGTSKVGAITIS